MVGEYTATTSVDSLLPRVVSYYYLLLPVAPSVSCPCVDARLTLRDINFHRLLAVSRRLPMSTTRLTLLPNPHPKAKGLVGVINCAGVGHSGPAEYFPIETYKKQFEVNFFGYVLCVSTIRAY